MQLRLIGLGLVTTLVAIAAGGAIAQQSPNPDAASFLNCLARYPKNSPQRQQPVTRYQFAVELDACLNEVTRPLQDGSFATKSEFDQVMQRQQLLDQELRELRDRVDNL